MANPEHLEILQRGAEEWYQWRKDNLGVIPDLSKANLIGANLIGANLDGANLDGANLDGANLDGANLVEANLSKAKLSEAKLVWANLIGANLSKTELIGAKLVRANLIGANLFRANLDGANLVEAKLVEANLSKAKLSEAKLVRANLIRANLIGANLDGANLDEANLVEANLSGANLSRADLSNAMGLTWKQISKAIIDETTKLPPELEEGRHKIAKKKTIKIIAKLIKAICIAVLAFWSIIFLYLFGVWTSEKISIRYASDHPTPTPTPISFPFPRPVSSATPFPYKDKLIAEARKQFGEGKIAFKAPEEMIVGKAEAFEARITHQQQTDDSLAEGLKGRGKARVKPLKVSYRMKVTLTAGDAFTIIPITPTEIRLLDPKEPYASWKWDVTPKKSGVHEIHLIAEAMAEIPKLGERSLYITTFDHIIRVGVTPDSVFAWVGQNWQYILGSIVIPLIGWLWVLYSKRKEKKEKEAGERKPPDPPKIIIP